MRTSPRRRRRDAAPDRHHHDGEREYEGRDLDRAEAERERLDQPREEHHRRDQEDGHLRRRRERDLGGELDLAAGRDDDGAAVLGGVADDRDDDGGDEEVGQMGLVGEDLDRADEDLGHEGGHDRGDAERGERRLERPAFDLVVARDLHVWCRRSV